MRKKITNYTRPIHITLPVKTIEAIDEHTNNRSKLVNVAVKRYLGGDEEAPWYDGVTAEQLLARLMSYGLGARENMSQAELKIIEDMWLLSHEWNQ